VTDLAARGVGLALSPPPRAARAALLGVARGRLDEVRLVVVETTCHISISLLNR
jgi:hypothetical protein